MRGHNSTIKRKKKVCIDCRTLSYIFSHGRCEQCARVFNANASDGRERIEDDLESVSILKKDADILFSRVVRLRASDADGMLKCFICNAHIHYTIAQAMHYTHREDSCLRLHPKNVRAGCKHCNEHLDGNLILYAEKLDAEEPNLSEWLYLEGKQPYKFTRDELKTAISDYSREIRLLLFKIKK